MSFCSGQKPLSPLWVEMMEELVDSSVLFVLLTRGKRFSSSGRGLTTVWRDDTFHYKVLKHYSCRFSKIQGWGLW